MKFDNTHLYHKIKYHIRQEILEKAQSHTEIRLDAERKMAEQWGVSRFSVNKAISELVAEGYLMRRRGKGVFIPPKEQLVAKESQLNMIALVLPDTHEYFYAEISGEIEKIAFANGINVMFCLIGNDQEKERAFLNSILQKRMVKGVIAAPYLSRENSIIYRKIHHSGIPVVLINRIHESMRDLPHIVYDQAQGAYLGVRHLFENGKKTFLYVGNERNGYHAFLRKQGFDRAVRELEGTQGFEIYADEEDFAGKLIGMIEHHRIDGIVVYNDNTATRVMNMIVNRGYKIPDDIGILGFDNSKLAEIALVPLTSVKFRKKELAARAFETILRLLQGEPCELEHIIPTSLEIRESTTVYALKKG